MTASEVAPFNVPEVAQAAHDSAVAGFSGAGTWLDGATRRAVVLEVRNGRTCSLCKERREALSWASVRGAHDTISSLTGPLTELAHRLSTDSGRVSNNWFEALMRDGLTPEEYVEVVGLVGTSTVTDTFSNALRSQPTPLPATAPGTPTNERNSDVVADGARVPLMDREKPLAPFGDRIGGRPLPNIVRALAMVPASLREFWGAFMWHYRPRDEDDGGLRRSQIELVASRTSALNECFY